MQSNAVRTRPVTSIPTWIALVSGLGGLLLGGLAFLTSLDDDDRERQVEQRLVCLELPGPNDCGLDGR
jgi:hypothetical protein